IRSQSVFQGPNGFDFDLYREALRRGGFSSETQYENIVGHQLMMEKIGVMIESATWVSPMELEDEIAAMTDKFTVQTVTLSNRFSDVEMRLSDEDYKTFYEENSASFRLPDRMSVRYIAIPVSNYLARVTVTDDLQDYYDAHLDRYQSTDTNNVVSTKSFEDVKDEIFAELQLDEARHCVETNVTFTIFGRLAKAAADNALAAMAAEENVEVVTSPLFAQYEPLPWVSDAREFAEAAFDLEPENFETRVSVVKGKNEIFVMEYHEKSEAHVPVFEDVAANVKTRAQAKARTDAFTSYVTEMRTDISSLLEAGKTFEDAAKEKALNVSTSFTYTANAIQMKPFENSYAIAYSARALRKGELSEAVPVAMSHAMLVYVEDRQQGEALVVDMASSQIRSGLARRRGNTLFSDWFTWNLGQQHLEPTRPLVTSDDDAAAPPDFDS
ncbi:MAG: peptidyl-prolyl cis-trans isomerase, partial [Kiritimatiellaeota bacterium]|nr:peptidyl-prolyl cis-trans isomerase [Kiritimatiellota bacterium]